MRLRSGMVILRVRLGRGKKALGGRAQGDGWLDPGVWVSGKEDQLDVLPGSRRI